MGNVSVIKRLTEWRLKEGMGREAALSHWRETHARLVEQVPGVKRYVQNHCTFSPDGSEPPYAGLGELWFESIDTANAALATPEWRAVLADAATFMDLEHVSAAWAEEHSIF
jgi:uncharacterized protein (TIGR02118 family)